VVCFSRALSMSVFSGSMVVTNVAVDASVNPGRRFVAA
jgi:hypothetical protein